MPHAVHVPAGSVARAARYAPRDAHECDAPLRVASATSPACGPSTSTSTRFAKRVVDVSHALDRRVEEATASRRARVALASTIAAGAGVPSGTYPLSASAPLPSEVKAAEKAQEKASGRAVVGDAGGEEKPKAKQEKSAGRLKELNDLRLELDLKELEVRQKSQELLRQEQTTAVLQEELELARRLNTILKSELDSAKEESKLSMGLCAQVGTF